MNGIVSGICQLIAPAQIHSISSTSGPLREALAASSKILRCCQSLLSSFHSFKNDSTSPPPFAVQNSAASDKCRSFQARTSCPRASAYGRNAGSVTGTLGAHSPAGLLRMWRLKNAVHYFLATALTCGAVPNALRKAPEHSSHNGGVLPKMSEAEPRPSAIETPAAA